MDTTALDITMLPLELFRAMLAEMMLVRGVKRALRLRLVNRFFSDEVIRMLRELRMLDDCQQWICRMGIVGADYMTHRLLHTSLPVARQWYQIRSISARLALEDDKNQNNYAHYVKLLCHRAAESNRHSMSILCVADWPFFGSLPDWYYDYNLLAAAAYTNKCRIMEELVDQPLNLRMIGGLFSHPHLCAAVAENDAALDLLFDKFETDKNFLLPHVSCYATTRMVEKFAPTKPVTSPPHLRRFWTPPNDIYITPNVATFEMLMRLYPQHEIKQSTWRWLLNIAVEHGWKDTIRHVIKMGAPVNVPDDFPLMRACELGFEGVVIVLLEHGIKLQDNDLTAAVKGGHLDVVKILIEAGADPNKGDPLPIVRAISMERKDVFRELIKHGASLDGENGAKAVKKAREEGLTSMLAFLGEHGVDIRE